MFFFVVQATVTPNNCRTHVCDIRHRRRNEETQSSESTMRFAQAVNSHTLGKTHTIQTQQHEIGTKKLAHHATNTQTRKHAHAHQQTQHANTHTRREHHKAKHTSTHPNGTQTHKHEAIWHQIRITQNNAGNRKHVLVAIEEKKGNPNSARQAEQHYAKHAAKTTGKIARSFRQPLPAATNCTQ